MVSERLLHMFVFLGIGSLTIFFNSVPRSQGSTYDKVRDFNIML